MTILDVPIAIGTVLPGSTDEHIELPLPNEPFFHGLVLAHRLSLRVSICSREV